jgi:flagellar biosynthesis protein FlhG
MLNDQAAGLRAMQNKQEKKEQTAQEKQGNPSGKKPVRVITVASGKGGVGKTNVSVNLGVSLSKLGNRVLLMDADMGLANVDVMLGLQTNYNLSHVLDGEKTLKEIIVEGPAGLKVIPAASGVRRMAELSAAENAGIINAFSELSDDLDVLIVDAAAGIAESVVSFCRAAQEVIVVVTDEPASITDAYALIKVLSRDFGLTRFRLLANMTRTPKQGELLYQKLARVCDQFLDVSIDYLGTIPFDHDLRLAVQKQVPVTLSSPNSVAAKSFREIARKIESWPIQQGPTGYLQFFVEQLFQH